MQIQTIVEDIYKLVGSKDGPFSTEALRALSKDTARRIGAQFSNQERKGTLRLSGMGPKCPRALWYSIHHPEMAEQLPPWAALKYTYGHILEAMVLALAKAAGHDVRGEQDEIILDGIVGHRDGVIDGCVVDVKSASSRAFEKFKTGRIAQEDSFGYLDQLDGYVTGSLEDPLVTVKDKGCLLVIDKTLGHLCLYEHTIRSDQIRMRIETYKEYVARDVSPPCTCGTVAEGKSGNVKLDTKASYSSFKHCCFPKLRTFLYSNGPVYLTKVIRTPEVMEIDKHSKVVYK